jgi:hypothetical protein
MCSPPTSSQLHCELRCRQRTEPAAQPPLPRRGLRDQILQLAPGCRKEGVKTGASDSAWLRDVLDRTERDVARLLFISEDKDLRAALAAWQYAEPLTRSLKDLLATLFVVTVDSGAATQVLLRYLLDILPAEQGANVFDIGEAPDLQSVVEQIIDPPEESPRIDNVTISRVTKRAGIVREDPHRPSIARTGGSRRRSPCAGCPPRL